MHRRLTRTNIATAPVISLLAALTVATSATPASASAASAASAARIPPVSVQGDLDRDENGRGCTSWPQPTLVPMTGSTAHSRRPTSTVSITSLRAQALELSRTRDDKQVQMVCPQSRLSAEACMTI